MPIYHKDSLITPNADAQRLLALADALAAAVEAWLHADLELRIYEEPACEHDSMAQHNEAVARAATALENVNRTFAAFLAARRPA